MPSTGTPASKIACGASGASLSSTEAGPPDRITPRGFIAANAAGRVLERHDLGIDPLLAHTPRDQLGHLGAEIDDENFVVGRLGHSPALLKSGGPWRRNRRHGRTGTLCDGRAAPGQASGTGLGADRTGRGAGWPGFSRLFAFVCKAGPAVRAHNAQVLRAGRRLHLRACLLPLVNTAIAVAS